MDSLITLDGALKIIRENVSASKKLKTEKVDSAYSVGRVISKDYYSDVDFPPFNKSAMDGFVVAACDRNEYKIVGSIKAGDFLDIELKEDECLSIMTGAPVNKNGIKVIIKENVDIKGDKIIVKKNSNNDNIAYKGEDLKTLDIAIKKNRLISPFSVGILANCGIKEVEVYKRIKISLAVTGDELVDINEKPNLGMIRNINTYSLLSKINSISFLESLNLGIIKDKLDDTIKTVKSFLDSESDVLLLSGGSSKGDFDFVIDALNSLGVKILFDGVKVQPGKPVIFAKHNDKIIFGLPGNPVSVLISFEIFVKEVLYRILGLCYEPTIFTAILEENFIRRNSERTLFFPIQIKRINDENLAVPVKYNGSGHISSYDNISHLGIMEEGVKELKKGSKINVRKLDFN
ncbi:MAG TPA: molybdopterin molybdotransferase MoeA [Spirochaetota bacterium]|nr:molybdopterin molybdotransferase MoeA [Spirochaetota bacterium]